MSLKCTVFLRVDNVQKKCKTSLTSSSGLFASTVSTGFVRVLENLESPGILQWHFPGLESPGKRLLVLESAGNLFNSNEKYEMYGRR